MGSVSTVVLPWDLCFGGLAQSSRVPRTITQPWAHWTIETQHCYWRRAQSQCSPLLTVVLKHTFTYSPRQEVCSPPELPLRATSRDGRVLPLWEEPQNWVKFFRWIFLGKMRIWVDWNILWLCVEYVKLIQQKIKTKNNSKQIWTFHFYTNCSTFFWFKMTFKIYFSFIFINLKTFKTLRIKTFQQMLNKMFHLTQISVFSDYLIC